VHKLLVRQRTMLINALRGHLAELGIVRARGHSGVKAVIEALHEAQNGLPELARDRESGECRIYWISAKTPRRIAHQRNSDNSNTPTIDPSLIHESLIRGADNSSVAIGADHGPGTTARLAVASLFASGDRAGADRLWSLCGVACITRIAPSAAPANHNLVASFNRRQTYVQSCREYVL